MTQPLLSIIVPTKNRYYTLKFFIQLFCSFQNQDMELVIQDNSDDNREILPVLQDIHHPHLVYDYHPESMPISQNSDLAVAHSSGRYVCMMGDDDLLSPYLYEFVQYMEQEGYQSASFDRASYKWPGVHHVAHKFPNLVIYRTRPNLFRVDVPRELMRILRNGVSSMGHLPHVYHGVVARECLDQVFARSGSYFPGPSPDMGNAIGLAFTVDRHLHCTLPYISAGASPRSTAGLGSSHQHVGDLKNKPFLPTDIEVRWCPKLPMVWSAQTIWAQSAVQALEAMGHQDLVQQLPWNQIYARFYAFNPGYRSLFRSFRKTEPAYASLPFWWAFFRVFLLRSRVYLRNLLITRLHCTALTQDRLPDICQAEAVIDQYLEQTQIAALFDRIR